MPPGAVSIGSRNLADSAIRFTWSVGRRSGKNLTAFIWPVSRAATLSTPAKSSAAFLRVMKSIWSAPRPRAIIDPAVYKYFLAGISHSGLNSFPSGHTTSAFALATILALHATKKGWGIFFLLLAVGVAYSRIYLGQHFLPDVTMGAILGTVSGLLVYAFVNIKLRRRTAAAELPEE